MDIGIFRGMITVILLVLFLGLWFWSWSKNRNAEYEAASQIPLEDDDLPSVIDKDTEQRS